MHSGQITSSAFVGLQTTSPIGFMQGRLSPLSCGRIQSFPWDTWKDEFVQAKDLGFHLMEWTLDQERLYENPLFTKSGQQEIRVLCRDYEMRISSLTGDCFMQTPFWKAQGSGRVALERDFCEVAKACAAVDIKMIVVPLVDNGRIENDSQEDILISFLRDQSQFLNALGLKILFESDFEPIRLAKFIDRLDSNLFGINYDIGNSAALGFSSAEEFDAYGSRILNVHIKDRALGGSTVPLGEGNVDFQAVFFGLSKLRYKGNYILQTARDSSGNHGAALLLFHRMTMNWLRIYAA